MSPKESKETKNIHDEHRKRMREKCIKHGAASFQTHELLEMMLYYCIPMKDTNPLAHKLLNEYGSLSMLLDADIRDMQRRCEVTERTALFFTILSEMMKRCKQERWSDREVLNTTQLAGEFAVSLLAYEKQECFYAILLDAQSRLINATLISRGTVDEAYIYPRLIVEAAIRYSATGVILAHNHPGGSIKPSFSDIEATVNVIAALNAIGIFVIDHFIVAEDKFISMSDIGLVKNKIKKEETETN